MKKIILLLSLLVSISPAAEPTVKRLGSRLDFVATGIEQVGKEAGPMAMGSYGDESIEGTHGTFFRMIDPGTWPTTRLLLWHRIKEALEAEKWVLNVSTPPPLVEDSNPRVLFIHADKDGKKYEAFIVMFPEPGGILRIGYQQKYTK